MIFPDSLLRTSKFGRWGYLWGLSDKDYTIWAVFMDDFAFQKFPDTAVIQIGKFKQLLLRTLRTL